MKYCFLDLETTGFEPEKDSILEVSFVTFEDGIEIDRFDKLIIPEKSPLNDFVAGLTGISQEELDKEGVSWESVKETINQKLRETVIVGHNIGFDIKFLRGYGIEIDPKKYIDTHQLARILLVTEESYALEVLSKKYGMVHESAHRAMSDVLASKYLFELLLEKIKGLPKDFLSTIKPLLKGSKTNWYAQFLFLETVGVSYEVDKEEQNLKTPLGREGLDSDNVFIPLGFEPLSSQFLERKTQSLNQKTLLISPKLDFYPAIPKFPTPEVLLNPKLIELFINSREALDDDVLVFIVKCIHRSTLGYRGVFYFDLFFKERDLWKEICFQSKEDEGYKVIKEEKQKLNQISLTPRAFCDFIEDEGFQDRILVIDESEQFLSDFLFSGLKTFSLQKYLNHKDEAISVKAQFIVSRFCQEVLESKLEHKISPFPQKVLLDPVEKITSFSDELTSLEDSEIMSFMIQNLEDPEAKIIRWVEYYPDNGNLVFCMWQPAVWKQRKAQLSNFKKIWGHRSPLLGESNPLYRIFAGVSEFEEKQEGLNNFPALEVPSRLISQSSPDFNSFCAQKIKTLFYENKGNMVVNFSSLETMRKIYDELSIEIKGDDSVFFTAEKVMGGNGKVLQMLKSNKDKKILFFQQKMVHPELADIEFKTIVMQKFPFNPPSPLLERIDEELKKSGQSLWDLWVIPQVMANISRRISCFNKAEKIIFLDPRENSRWGKPILKHLFNY